MSASARRFRKSDRKLCPCGKPALYFSHARGCWRNAADHPYCTRCWQSEVDSMRARSLTPTWVVMRERRAA